MDQRIRLTVATAVMLIGLGVALCFRRESGNTGITLPPQGDLATVGKQPDPRNIAVLPPPVPRPLPVAPRELRHPGTVTANDQPAPPPDFPKSYSANGQTADNAVRSNGASGNDPQNNQMASARWGSAMSDVLPERRRSLPKHRIVDGDTLPLLAERYLGSASRANEIYEANRDVLADPNILPVRTVLKIPGGEK
jgi:nucleoid-associated protein YgaU